MTTLRPPKSPKNYIFKCRNSSCQAIFMTGDSAKYVAEDLGYGAIYTYSTCPHCGNVSFAPTGSALIDLKAELAKTIDLTPKIKAVTNE